jgi:starch-binding outer membrane protein, SusD/RagB family
MKLNIKSFFAIGTFFIFFCLLSCKKFLTQEPYNRISINDIFKDFEGARTTLIGCYDNLLDFNMYGRDLMIYADLTGGNIKYVRASNQLFNNTYNFNNDAISNNDLKSFSEKAYNTIYRTNSVLENINQIVDATPLQINRMKADAFLIRAISHFSLVSMFAQMPNFTPDASHTGIVLRLKNTIGIVPLDPPSTVAQVYASINTDIDSAKLLYANSVNVYATGSDKTWLSLNAAKALQCRVKLYSQNNTEVITLATDLINASTTSFPLLSTAAYINAWKGKTLLSESIFELNYGSRIAGSMGDYFNPLSTTPQFGTSNDLLSLYTAGDVRGNNNMFYTAAVPSLGTFVFTKKWSGYRDSANNTRMFRLSEIYLNRAEAFAKLGDATSLQAACNDLNLIRKRGFGASVNILPGIGQSALIMEILLERRRELCFEGQLLFDIARNKQNIVRVDCNAAINCSVTFPSPKYFVPYPIN